MTSDIEEQIKKIEEEIRETPYNKSTEQHIGRLKAKIAKLKEKKEKREKGKSEGGGGYDIRKEGDATVALVGLPSVGKSTILNKLTNAESEVASYHFTTLDVIPGIMEHNGAEIQLLDLPGLVEGASEGKGRGREILSVIRNVDLIIMIGDIYRSDISKIIEELHSHGIRINQEPPDIKIEEKDKEGIKINTTVELENIRKETIMDILREFGYVNANVVIRSNIDDQELVDFLSKNRVYLPGFPIINKIDLIDEEKKNSLADELQDYSPLFISAEKGDGVQEVKQRIFDELDFIRIFLRPQGEKADDEPMVLKRGSTVKDVCKKLHSSFVENFRYARVWGPTAKFPKQKVGMDHELAEGDTVRILTK
ncbi:MAG: 50S ribosome-binding GTPase [Candidatus Thermoplasmatota archaeon]|nr:50S ribosome-binding GTPase [Candidatus Thermoplasmatota archaeon]MBS3790996.1 50S ribosome-binding GTPase [Candidatus Thermoplasmatota archaeon]